MIITNFCCIYPSNICRYQIDLGFNISEDGLAAQTGLTIEISALIGEIFTLLVLIMTKFRKIEGNKYIPNVILKRDVGPESGNLCYAHLFAA